MLTVWFVNTSCGCVAEALQPFRDRFKTWRINSQKKRDFAERKPLTGVRHPCTRVIWVIYKRNPRLPASLMWNKEIYRYQRKAVLSIQGQNCLSCWEICRKMQLCTFLCKNNTLFEYQWVFILFVFFLQTKRISCLMSEYEYACCSLLVEDYVAMQLLTTLEGLKSKHWQLQKDPGMSTFSWSLCAQIEFRLTL